MSDDEITKAYDGAKIITFEGLNEAGSKWSYRTLGKRCPSRGEFYLSGAIPAAYKARQHLAREYYVVEPLREYRRETVWVVKSKLKA